MPSLSEVKTHKSIFRVEKFANTLDFANALKTRDKSKWGEDSLDTTDKWALGDGIKNGEQALDYFRNGYSETVKDIEYAVNNTIKAVPQTKNVLISSGVVGFAPIVPNALLGLPNSMVAVKRKQIKSKVVDILYSGTVGANTSTDAITKAGIKLLEYIVKLEKKGYRVRLSIFYCYYENHDADVCIIPIKSENEPMTLSRLSFPLTTPAMFRCLSFAWYERSPQTKHKSGYGCCICYEFKKEECEQIGKDILNRPNSKVVYMECKDIITNGDKYIEEQLKDIL